MLPPLPYTPAWQGDGKTEANKEPQSCAPPGFSGSQGHLFQPIKLVFVKLKLQIVCREDFYATFKASVVQVFRGTLTA